MLNVVHILVQAIFTQANAAEHENPKRKGSLFSVNNLMKKGLLLYYKQSINPLAPKSTVQAQTRKTL